MFDPLKIQKNYCVAFVDILGFKSMTSNKEIEKYGAIINKAIDNMRNVTVHKNGLDGSFAKDDIRLVQFADSIVILFPKSVIHCLSVIEKLSWLQFELATEGILLRGAICSGQMYIDFERDVYYGEAWNKAVQQEERAIYPRIILEMNLAKMVKRELKRINESVYEFVLSEDAYFVLNTYAGYSWISGSENSLSFEDGIRRIIKSIDANSKAKELEDGILRKYIWLAKMMVKVAKGNDRLEMEAKGIWRRLINRLF